MAAKKKTKARTATKKKKSGSLKKSGAAKKKAKASRKPAKKTVRKTARKAAAKTAAASKTVKAKKKSPARAKAPVRKKKQVVGEGDYEASRTFLKDQADFVKKNKARIPAMGKEAERALDGPEGASLRAAEADARRHGAPDAESEATAPGTMVIPPG